jgi:UTP-glucose-1-phosphate uridylyltransferase
VQQTICELIKDMFVVRQLKIWKGDASCKGRPHVENKLFTVVLNDGVFMNSDGQKSWCSHDFLFVPTEPKIYTKKSGAVLLRTISTNF